MSLQHQAGRVAERFALAAAALELAAPVTGLPVGVGMAGVRKCFDDWLEINGTGKFEDEEILDTAMVFLSNTPIVCGLSIGAAPQQITIMQDTGKTHMALPNIG